MATRILLVRHGETAWNRGEVFRGRADVVLDDTGRLQARALRAALLPHGPVAVYASPLSRAVETARIAVEPLGLSVRTEEALIDIDYGRWQGRGREEVRSAEPDLYDRWLRAPETVTFPGGESLAAVRDRALPALLEIAERHPGETVLVVAHRVVNKVLLCEILGAGLGAFWRVMQTNACLNILAREGDEFQVTLLNDTCHLAGVGCGALTGDF